MCPSFIVMQSGRGASYTQQSASFRMEEPSVRRPPADSQPLHAAVRDVPLALPGGSRKSLPAGQKTLRFPAPGALQCNPLHLASKVVGEAFPLDSLKVRLLTPFPGAASRRRHSERQLVTAPRQRPKPPPMALTGAHTEDGFCFLCRRAADPRFTESCFAGGRFVFLPVRQQLFDEG